MKTVLRRRLALVCLLPALLFASCAAPPAPAGSRLSPSNHVFEVERLGLKHLWPQELGQLTSSTPLVAIYCAGKYVVVEVGKGEVHCIDSTRGAWVGTAVLTDYLDRAPAASGERIFFIVHGRIFTFDVASGKLSAGYDPLFPIAAPPVPHRGDLILAGTNGHLAMLPIGGTDLTKLISLKGAIFDTPIVVGNRIYAASSMANILLVWDLEGKRELWEWAPEKPSSITSGPAVAHDTVYIGDNRGFLYALTAEYGQQTWKTKLEAPVVGQPVAVGSKLLVLTDKPSLICREAAGERKQLWRQDGVVRILTVGKEVAYVFNDDGTVSAIVLETGKERWNDPLPRDCVIDGDPLRPVFYIADSAGSIAAFQELE